MRPDPQLEGEAREREEKGKTIRRVSAWYQHSLQVFLSAAVSTKWSFKVLSSNCLKLLFWWAGTVTVMWVVGAPFLIFLSLLPCPELKGKRTNQSMAGLGTTWACDAMCSSYPGLLPFDSTGLHASEERQVSAITMMSLPNVDHWAW